MQQIKQKRKHFKEKYLCNHLQQLNINVFFSKFKPLRLIKIPAKYQRKIADEKKEKNVKTTNELKPEIIK